MGRAYQNRKDSMAKTSDAKAKLYSRYGREIYMSAKSGSTDPSANLTLRGLIEKAKKDQVPTHVIDKAIDKAKGGVGEDFAPTRYEGYGPSHCMVIVECLTDNPTRSFAEVRNCFTKSKSKLGNPGSVAHMFDHCAIFVFNGDEDEVLMALLEADVDATDIESEDGKITVFTPQSEYINAKRALETAFADLVFEVDEVQFLAQSSVSIAEEDIENFDKLISMLDLVDDVQSVWHNAER